MIIIVLADIFINADLELCEHSLWAFLCFGDCFLGFSGYYENYLVTYKPGTDDKINFKKSRMRFCM